MAGCFFIGRYRSVFDFLAGTSVLFDDFLQAVVLCRILIDFVLCCF